MGRLLGSAAWILAGAALAAAPLVGESAGRAVPAWALGAFLLLAAALAAAGRALEGGLAPSPSRRAILVPACILVVCLAWAALRAPEPWSGRLVLLEWGLGVGLAATLAVWASPARGRAVAPLLLGAGGALAVFALYQRLWGLGALRTAFDLNPGLAGPDAVWSDRGRVSMASRLSSGEPFANFALSNTLAAYLLMVLPLAAGLAWDRWKESRRGASWVLAVLASVSAVLLPLTGSKGALLAAGLTLMGWSLRRAWAHRRARAATALIALAIFGALAARLISKGPLHHSTSFRMGYWAGAGRAVLEHPWAGLGLDGFKAEYNRLRPVWARDVTKVHCDPLQLWAEAGLWALLAASWLGGLCWWRARSRMPDSGACGDREEGDAWIPLGMAILPAFLIWQLPDVLHRSFFRSPAPHLRILVAAGMSLAAGLSAWAARGPWGVGARVGALAGTLFLAIHSLGDIDLTVPGVAWPFWALLGALAAQSEAPAPEAPGSRKPGWGSLVFLVVLLAGLLPFLLRWAPRSLAAEQAVLTAQDHLVKGKPLDQDLRDDLLAASALGYFEALTMVGNESARRWRAGADDGSFHTAVSARLRAAELNPGNARVRLDLARLFLDGAPEHPERALSALDWSLRAVEAFPTAPQLRLEAARFLMAVLSRPETTAEVAKAWSVDSEAAARRIMLQITEQLHQALALDAEVLEEGKRLQPGEKAWAEGWLRGES